MIKKIKNKIKLFTHGLAHGMKGADEVISTKASYGSSDSAIIQTQIIDNIYNDLLQGEETQRVKEMRDEYYRTIHESSKIAVSVNVTGGNIDNDFDNPNIELSATSRKKTALDFVCKIEVYNPEKLHLKCIQDNIIVPVESGFNSGNLCNGDSVSIFNITRGEFIPRFKIENYVNKLVIRNIDDKTSYLDFYIPMYASQFGFTYTKGKNDSIEIKKDNSSLLISELNKLMKKELRTSDVVEIKGLKFQTEKAYGVPNPSFFEFNNITYNGVNTFDGNFVITLKADNVVNGYSAIEKYHTNELDEKLANEAPREGKTIDLETILRHERKKNEKKLDS